MSKKINGGKYALAGYFYQILSLSSLTVQIYEETLSLNGQEQGTEPESLFYLSNVDISSSVVHEVFGQDAFLVLLSEEDYKNVLVQFKYTATNNPIGKTELEDIFSKFGESAERVEKEGMIIDACVLVTNRSLREPAEERWEKERQKDLDYEIENVNQDMEQAIENLTQHGKSFGLYDYEIELGMNNIIGNIFGDTVKNKLSKAISIQDIDKWLTQINNPRKLIFQELKEICKHDIEDFGNKVRIDQWNGKPVPRREYQELFEGINERALLCLYGPGGCGKSVLLWQLFHDALDRKRALCKIEFSNKISDKWVIKLIDLWRNKHYEYSGDDIEKAIKRLVRANGQLTKPILWLAIDGLDENIRFHDKGVYSIINYFWDVDRKARNQISPIASLVVTCREKSVLLDKLNLNYDFIEERPLTILLDIFSENELRNALERNFPFWFERSNVVGIESEPAFVNHTRLDENNQNRKADFYGINKEVLNSLRHPVIWRSLLNLDEDIQINVLKGDIDAINRLAEEFIGWFIHKLVRRTIFKQKKDHVKLALEKIANKVGVDEEADQKKWKSIISETRIFTEIQANDIFYEMILGGLIISDDSIHYRWRHKFIVRYLTKI